MSNKEKPGLAATSTPVNIEILHNLKNTPKGEPWKCPCCSQLLPFQSLAWFDKLPALVARYGEEMGISHDISGFTFIELYGVYLFLNGQGS
jgi:hypothetical protein